CPFWSCRQNIFSGRKCIFNHLSHIWFAVISKGQKTMNRFDTLPVELINNHSARHITSPCDFLPRQRTTHCGIVLSQCVFFARVHIRTPSQSSLLAETFCRRLRSLGIPLRTTLKR